LESWKDLIQREYTTEKQREDIRLVLQEHAIKIKNLLKNIDNNEEEDDEDDNAEESVEEKEHTKEDDFRLSINKPVVNKKKTKTQRNRQRRHQESVKLHAELRDLKEKIAELEKIPEFESQIREPSKKHATTSERIQKRKKLGTKHQVKQQNLDIKLSDELTDSLRGLKPEGNLLQDTMFSIQSKGQVEARIPIKGKRRYQQKVTEKWTYKDFK
jgi:nucleolar protein 53